MSQDHPAWGEGAAFGAAVAALLGGVTRRLLRDVETYRLPLQPDEHVVLPSLPVRAQLLSRLLRNPGV